MQVPKIYILAGTDANGLQFDLATLSAESLRRYLVKFNLVPPMYPGPSTSYTPPLPSHLVNPPPPPPERSDSPGSATASSRPRRDPKTRTNSNGRRSSRLLEDELQQSVYAGVKETHGNPILPDLRDADKALVEIARKHWETIVLRENDVLEEFSSSIRNKGMCPAMYSYGTGLLTQIHL